MSKPTRREAIVAAYRENRIPAGSIVLGLGSDADLPIDVFCCDDPSEYLPDRGVSLPFPVPTGDVAISDNAQPIRTPQETETVSPAETRTRQRWPQIAMIFAAGILFGWIIARGATETPLLAARAESNEAVDNVDALASVLAGREIRLPKVEGPAALHVHTTIAHEIVAQHVEDFRQKPAEHFQTPNYLAEQQLQTMMLYAAFLNRYKPVALWKAEETVPCVISAAYGLAAHRESDSSIKYVHPETGEDLSNTPSKIVVLFCEIAIEGCTGKRFDLSTPAGWKGARDATGNDNEAAAIDAIQMQVNWLAIPNTTYGDCFSRAIYFQEATSIYHGLRTLESMAGNEEGLNRESRRIAQQLQTNVAVREIPEGGSIAERIRALAKQHHLYLPE